MAEGSAAQSSRAPLRTQLQRAVAFHQRGRLLEAERLYEAILEVHPQHFDALHLLGVIAAQTHRPERALLLIEKAISLNAASALSHYNRGLALKALGRFEEALASYGRAAELDSRFATAWFERGFALTELGEPRTALASYDRAIAIKNDYAEAHYNRALLLRILGQFDAALDGFDRAIAARPGYARAYTSRGTTRLLCGDLEGGWKDFEWRWRDETHTKEWRRFPQPQWSGQEPLSGRSILLHGEQGLGDTLHFCRYARLVAERGATVVLEVPAPLVRLLATLEGVAQVVARGTPLPECDYHCSLMSLPFAFKTTLSTIPARIPYLRSDAAKLRQWRARLGESTKLKVGLVWAGGFRPDQPECWAENLRRNIPLKKLAALRHPDIEFYGLQKGQPAESELTALAPGWDGPSINDLAPFLIDFADTAAVLENLDLLISVDTATAHLAGALGRRVWILNRYDNCWRWLLDRSDSPWYPTARLYRQEAAGDWDGVVRNVRDDLFRLSVPARA